MEKKFITLWDNPNERGVWSFDGEYIYDPAGNKYDEVKIRATFWYHSYQTCIFTYLEHCCLNSDLAFSEHLEISVMF